MTGNTKRVLGFLLLASLAAGGYAIGRMTAGPAAPTTTSTADVAEDEQLYTCGMHPNVIQKGPGTCPICGMNLTPVRKGGAGGAGAAGAPAERKIKYWVAPMDPNYISDKPGKSPMGMDLVPVYETEGENKRAVVIDPTVVQNIGVRTAAVERGPLTRTIRATGEVVEDETRVGIVNLKVDGWVDQVYVDETGEHVDAGDPLIDIYSPQLVSTQEEFLVALNHLERVRGSGTADVVSAAERNLESARRRLLYWDVPEKQVDELEQTGQVKKTITLRSPFTGVVTMKGVLPGQRIHPGTDLYHIADLSRVWVETSIFEEDIPYISLGQKAVMTLPFAPGRSFAGDVTFISPVLREKTRDLAVRLEFLNPGGSLRPGMYADVTMNSKLADEATLVPNEAVIRSGKKDVVFLARGEGRFIPAEVRLGVQASNGRVQVLRGVVPGEKVVTSAQFLLDSESAFQEALQKMASAGEAAPAEAKPDTVPTDPVAAATIRKTGTYYACSDPKHAAAIQARPGTCPLDGSELVPHDASYTCPMKECGTFSDDEDADCPVCGMPMIPFDEWVKNQAGPEKAAEWRKQKKESTGATAGAKPHSHAGKAVVARAAATGSPFAQVDVDGQPVANAISVGSDGTIEIACPVMKGTRMIDAGKDPYTLYKGKRVYYCCPGCQGEFEKDPNRYMADLQAFLSE